MDEKDRRVLRRSLQLVESMQDKGWEPGECIRIYTGAIGLVLSWSQFNNKEDIVDGVHEALLHIIGKDDNERPNQD
jgi:hypothetical protein